jgi:hypothetical protein
LLVAGSSWEKSTAGWWLISRANRLLWTLSKRLGGSPPSHLLGPTAGK